MIANDPSTSSPPSGPDLRDEREASPPEPGPASRPARDANPVLVRTRSLLDRVGSPFVALRTAREEAGLSLSDLSDHLAVRPAFLEAVEAGDLATLPGSSYAGSLINMYATNLGLDGESLVEAAFPAAPMDAPGAASAAPGPRRIISGARLLPRRPSFTPGAPPPPAGRAAVQVSGVSPDAPAVVPPQVSVAPGTAPTGTDASPEPPRNAVLAVDAPYAGDPVPAKPLQWLPAPSTLAVPGPSSITAAQAGPAVRLLRWVALVLFVAVVLAVLVLIGIVLVRSFEPQTPLGMLLPWLPGSGLD